MIGPLGAKLACDAALIIAGTGMLAIGKNRLRDDISEIGNQMMEPTEDNIYEVEDFETTEF